MKKRLLAMLLTLATVMSLIVIPTNAEESEIKAVSVTDPATTICSCGCGKKLEEITWKPWAGKPGSGHYYLTGNYVMPEFNVISGEKTVLDLRGYTITTEAATRLFTVNGYLAILDTVGGGRATAKAQNKQTGGVIKIADYETTGSKFELFSGTITLAAGHTTPASGGLVYACTGATFVMHGGVLLEGVSGSNGGCVGISGADVSAQILGGKIIGGTADDNGGNISVTAGATVTVENTTIIGGTAKSKGGNLFVSASTANVDNCSIGNGVSNHTTTKDSKYGGGNICTYDTATLNLENSEIYGGYALMNGGNVCFGNGTHVLKNNHIWGGTCENLGANLYSSLPKAISTIEGGTIDGDVYYNNSPLTLKGAVKIGMNATGLVLKQSSKTVKVSGLTEGAEIYVSGNTSMISGGLTYLKPALNATLSASGSTVTVTPTDGAEAGACTCGSAKTIWQPYGTENATHVYLTEDKTDFAEVTVSSDLCIDLRGFDITAAGRAFNVASGAKLNIIDSVGGAIVTGAGVAGENGGVINNAGELTIRGGKYVYAAGNAVTGGGIIYTSSKLTVANAILDASAFNNTADGVCGGAVYVENASGNITLSGCRILGGKSYIAGGVRMGYNNNATIAACQFLSGKSLANGGNLSVSGDSDHANGFLTMTKTYLRDGETSGAKDNEYGGNLYITRWGARIEDCYIRDGEANEFGGNVSFGVCPSSGVIFTDSILSGGVSKSKGGNIYASGKSKKIELVDCLVLDGSAAIGGNINIKLAVFAIKGGEVSHGTSTGNGGNIYAGTSGGMTLADGVMLRGGKSSTYGGNLYVAEKVTLEDVTFHNGSATTLGDDIYLSGAASTNLIFSADMTGDVYLCASNSILSKGENGTVVGNLSMAEGATLNANIYLGGDFDNAAILQMGDTFYTASALVVDSNGERHWFESNAAAVQAASAGDCLKVYSDDGLVLDKDLYVDLNGHKVIVSGSGTVYGLDSVGDDYSVSAGWLKAEPGIIVAEETTALNGNRYITLTEEDGTYSFHRFEMKITGVNIRPNAAGMYYSAKWACDDVLKEQITSYGVVASTANMPGADFASEEENLYTAFTKDTFVSGATKNGAVIKDILENSDNSTENNANGKTKVYAKAYMIFKNGKTLVSADNIRFSLYDVMKNLDQLIMKKPVQYRKYTNIARNFYETWKDSGMGGWNLNKIPDPGEDGVVNVLMIGNSGCYYYVEEMHAMAAAAGVDLRVCNVYYSGCPLYKHYNWWVNGESNYQFYETYTDGRKCTDNVSLEWCLAQYEWDFISLQESSALAENGAETHFAEAKQYWDTLLSYLIEQFPNAQICWKENAGRQIPYSRNNVTYTEEDQARQTETHKEFSKLLSDYYNEPGGQMLLKPIPVAGTWANVRANGYDYLCARLNTTHEDGTPHAGDGSHDGDIGGGQFLNACVWIETLLGISCLDIDYIPEYKSSAVIGDDLMAKLHIVKTETGYTLDPEFAAMLRQAAHDAVAEYGYTVVSSK